MTTLQRADAAEHAMSQEPWHRPLGRPASESGRLRSGDGAHGSGARRQRVLELPSLRLPLLDLGVEGFLQSTGVDDV